MSVPQLCYLSKLRPAHERSWKPHSKHLPPHTRAFLSALLAPELALWNYARELHEEQAAHTPGYSQLYARVKAQCAPHSKVND